MTWPPATPAGPAYTYRATCHRIIDGDTFEADVDLGFATFTRISVRLHGVNAPEIGTPDGPPAREFLRAILGEPGEDLPTGTPSPLLLTSLRGARSFARWVCDVWVLEPDGVKLVAEEIISHGHGVPLDQ